MIRATEGALPKTEHHDVVLDDGTRLHVATAGDGPPVVLLHGFPEEGASWHRQIPALVAAGMRVIVPDQRGYGQSDRPEGVAAYRLDRLARDIVEIIAWTGAEAVSVVGHDWGGAVAWAVAAHHPDRVRRLVVLNMPHPTAFAWGVLTDPRQLLRSAYVFAFQLPWLAEAILTPDRLERTMFAHSATRPFTPAEIAKRREAWGRPGAIRAMLAWYRAAGRWPFALWMGRIACPTRVIWGRQDRALGASLVPPTLARCDHGEVVWVDEAAHFVQHDAPEQVNEAIVSFLQEDP